MGLLEDIKKYSKAYRAGTPIISDEVYDNLVEQLRDQTDGNEDFLNEVEPEEFNGRKQIKHPYPMLSTDKAYNIEQLGKFCIRLKSEADSLGIKLLLRVTPKLDGLAGRDDGKFFVTRGNGELGYEISDAFNKGVKIIGEKRGQGLGEIVVVKSYFEKYLSNVFAHPRNMTVGIVTSDNVNENVKQALLDGQVQFVPYSQLPDWIGEAKDLIINFDKIKNNLLSSIDYPNDGIIVEAVHDSLKHAMGATSHHYKWQIAVKSKGEVAEAIVDDIVWQVGRTGNVTPVIIIEPTLLSGATIQRVTAHHARMIESLKIGKGSRIEIIRSGEVIPKLEKVFTESDMVYIPTTCPSCKMPLLWQNDFLKCISTNCPSKKIQQIKHWFHTLGTSDWFGVKTIAKLVENKWDSLKLIYTMSTEDFEKCGFGPTQASNLYQSCRDTEDNKVEDWRFLAAFGIPNLGKGDSKKLLKNHKLEDLFNLTQSDICTIDGFGEITSDSIVNGLNEIKDLFDFFIRLGFNLIRSIPISEIKTIESPITGKCIVFTGKMNHKREEMQEYAASLGAIIQSSVNKKTNILVCGENVGPKKIEKAKQLGTQVITENEYHLMINRSN